MILKMLNKIEKITTCCRAFTLLWTSSFQAIWQRLIPSIKNW